MATVRPLDRFETLFTRIGNYGPDTAEYEGVIDELALSSAYSALCACHPVLAGQIRRSQSHYEIAVPAANSNQIITLEGDEDTLRRQLLSIRESSNCYDCSKLIHIRGDHWGLLSLVIHHAIADYKALGTYFNKLWQLYTDIYKHGKTEIECTSSLPRSFLELWTERYQDGSLSPTRTPLRQPGIPEKNGIYLQRTVRLSQTETSHVLASSRTYNVSVHGIVCGAILIALRELHDGDDPAKMECHSVVDLRNRVNPPVGATETTNFDGLHVAELEVSPQDSIIALAEDLNRQLMTALDSPNSILTVAERGRFIETPIEDHLSPILVSNGGVVPELETPPGVRILDRLKGFLGGAPAPFSTPTYAVLTHLDRLKIIGWYPSGYFTEEDLSMITDRIIHLLRQLPGDHE